jgi:hypothetical protein
MERWVGQDIFIKSIMQTCEQSGKALVMRKHIPTVQWDAFCKSKVYQTEQKTIRDVAKEKTRDEA